MPSKDCSMENKIDPTLVYKWKIGVRDPRKYIIINKVSDRKIYYTQCVDFEDGILREKFSKFISEFLDRFEVDWARSSQKIFKV